MPVAFRNPGIQMDAAVRERLPDLGQGRRVLGVSAMTIAIGNVSGRRNPPLSLLLSTRIMSNA